MVVCMIELRNIIYSFNENPGIYELNADIIPNVAIRIFGLFDSNSFNLMFEVGDDCQFTTPNSNAAAFLTRGKISIIAINDTETDWYVVVDRKEDDASIAVQIKDFIVYNRDWQKPIAPVAPPVAPPITAPVISSSASFIGKNVVLTGKLSISRLAAKQMIEGAGGHIASAVTGNTDYLIAGARSGSKLTTARQVGVPVLDEETMMHMLAPVATLSPNWEDEIPF